MSVSKPKKLYRNADDRIIAGVCSGLAEYMRIDVAIIRVIFAILLLPGGLPGFIPYVLLWILVPLKSGNKG